MENLGRRETHFAKAPGDVPAPPQFLGQADEETLTQWLEVVASQWELEVEPAQTSYAEVEQFVRRAGPTLLRLPASFCEGEAHFLVILKEGWWHIVLIGPDLSRHRVRAERVRDALCAEV